jgi:hypothetical protein
MSYKEYGYEGYEYYDFRADDTFLPKGYLKWNKSNDDLISNKNFDWNSIFKPEPYLEYKANYKGSVFPQLPAFTIHGAIDFYKSRNEEYSDFIKRFGLHKMNAMECLNHIQAYHEAVKNNMNHLINNLENIDSDIRDVLKVFYYECEKEIKPKNDDISSEEKYYQLLNDITSMYRIIRQGIHSDKLEEHWIPKRITRSYVPDAIGKSISIGVPKLQKKKEPLLEKLTELYKQLVHLETIKIKCLNQKPLLDTDDMPEINIDDKIESAKNESQKKMYEDGKRNIPNREKVIKIALEIMEKDRKQIHHYLTKKRDINSNLYGRIRQKTGQSRSNICRWLKKHFELEK